MPTFLCDRLSTPVGELLIVTDDEHRLHAIDWCDHETRLMKLLTAHYHTISLRHTNEIKMITGKLADYFDGDLTGIDTLSVMAAGTEFQRKVWRELRHIPYGQTLTYAELAQRIQQPTAARAVGMANSKNPVSIVVPCHRVIGANGTLTGYAGGVERKRWLLQHEGLALI